MTVLNQEGSYRLPDYARPFLLEGGAHGLLLIHGFTATPALVRPLGEALHRARIDRDGPLTVQGILLPGHGTRIEDMRSHGGYAPWLDAARSAFDALAARCERVSVIGHSMGGVLALLLAEERPVHAVIPIAAPMRLSRRSARLAPLVSWAKPFVMDKPQRRASENDEVYDFGYGGTPLCRVGDLLRLMRQAERNLHRIECPLLVAQSRDDATVRPVSADIIYRGAGSARKEMLWMEQSGHACTVGPERALLFEACAAFLRGIDGAAARKT